MRMANRVLYISSARDDEEAHRLLKKAELRSPFVLFLEDVAIFAKSLPFMMNVFRPMRMTKPLPGVHFDKSKLTRDYILCGIVSVLELIILIVTVPLFLVLPGLLFLIYIALAFLLISGLCRLSWGDIIVDSKVDLSERRFNREKWFYINGIATSHAMLQASCDMLSASFKRPVTGIYNKSFGMIGDVLECLVQRSFDYQTEDVRIAYEALKEHLDDSKNIDKVVVVAHSQGGILISLVLDRLYATMPSHVFAKLEIYTFGSAAAHFHNPMITLPTEVPPLRPLSRSRTADALKMTTNVSTRQRNSGLTSTESTDFMTNGHSSEEAIAGESTTTSLPSDPPDQARYIPVIEHYCNALDIVPLWGVLYHVSRNTPTTYSGKIFVHEKQQGHLFDQHYLETMFPLDKLAEIRRYKPPVNNPDVDHRVENEDEHGSKVFLNHVVREEGPYQIKKASTFKSAGQDAVTTVSEMPNGDSDERAADEQPMVKDLSNLWRYLGGGDGIA